MKVKTAIFHGPSGSGKDTQLDLLEKKFSFERIGVSTIMRALEEEGHEIAKEANEFAKKGLLSPDSLVYEMLDIWLSRIEQNARWFFVSPIRIETQIKLFDDLLDKHDRELELFVHFKLSEKTAIERMSVRTVCPKCGTSYHPEFKPEKIKGFCDKDDGKLMTREDDKPESIIKRLSWYNKDIDPILKEYEKRGILLEVDAAPSIEDIHLDLIGKLKNYEKALR